MTEPVHPSAAESEATFKRMRDALLARPHATIGYMSAIRFKSEFRAGDIKALFNHAGRPLPADLAARNDDETCRLGLLKKANLVFLAAHKGGDNIVKSAVRWVRSF